MKKTIIFFIINFCCINIANASHFKINIIAGTTYNDIILNDIKYVDKYQLSTNFAIGISGMVARNVLFSITTNRHLNNTQEKDIIYKNQFNFVEKTDTKIDQFAIGYFLNNKNLLSLTIYNGIFETDYYDKDNLIFSKKNSIIASGINYSYFWNNNSSITILCVMPTEISNYSVGISVSRSFNLF